MAASQKKHFLKRMFPTNTLMFRFTAIYILSLFFVILLVGSTLIGTVGYSLLQNTKKEMHSVQQKLKSVPNGEQDDWQGMLDQLLYPDHANYYVVIQNASGDILARSRGWRQTFNGQQQQVQSHWLGPLLWDQQKGFFLLDKFSWTQRNGRTGQIKIAVRLTDLEKLLKLIAQILVLTALLGMFIGSLLIYRLTRSNLRPLFAITDATERIKNSSDLKQQIPVPKGPRELVNLSETLNNMLSQLEEQFEREKSFTANASHELRTPLTALRGHLKILKRWGKNDPKVLNESIEAMDQEGERMQRLIIQLLAMARSDGRVRSRNEKPFDLSEVVKSAIPSEALHHKKIGLNTDLLTPALVKGDAEQLREVIIILLDNAIKYTESGGNIEIRIREQAGTVRLDVCDTGIGIPNEDLSRIFERFYRVDKARSENTGGTGLGLALARQLVERQGGKITVKSELGKGSVFTVYLPADKLQEE